MSDPPVWIGLAVEGETDAIVIESIVEAVRPGLRFVATTLQPEVGEALAGAHGRHGGGWGGVLKWCSEATRNGRGHINRDPSLGRFAAVVIHLDADVADETYSKANLSDPPKGADLPCSMPCPPARATVEALRDVVFKWCGVTGLASPFVLCIPSKAMEAWVLAALYPDNKAVSGGGLECLKNPAARLPRKPAAEKLEKRPAAYEPRRGDLTKGWANAVRVCAEARRFHEELLATLPNAPIPQS